ncbi:MAG: hypothetical protein ACM34N_12995 [Ignavibacteria bacterium]
MTPWFKLWFDTVHYHKLYSRHDEKEAADFIDNLLINLKPFKNSSMLDAGCGAGRHADIFSYERIPGNRY